MSQEDIGSYVGLTIESVSCLLSKFKQAALICVDKREIQLLDLPRLKLMASQSHDVD
jgi:CRP/FNR family transcriptional regulator